MASKICAGQFAHQVFQEKMPVLDGLSPEELTKAEYEMFVAACAYMVYRMKKDYCKCTDCISTQKVYAKALGLEAQDLIAHFEKELDKVKDAVSNLQPIQYTGPDQAHVSKYKRKKK
jgi:hypothetical protein